MSEDDYKSFMDLYNDDTYESSQVVYNVTVQLSTKDNQLGAKFIPVFYYFNFLLSYLGNGLVLFIIYSLPFLATYHLYQWIFGVVLCKMVSSAYFIGVYSSILFLTLMTFDRYLAVVHAVSAAKTRKKVYAVIASVAVWCISIVASVKELVFQNVWKSADSGLVCEESGFSESTMKFWRLFTYYQQFLIFFLLPLFMVMYCYIGIAIRILSTRMAEKCRAIKLIFVIIFTFFACWTPYNIVIFLQALQISGTYQNNSTDLDNAVYITRSIAYLYCCISPVFYTFVGKKFQNHFKRLVAKKIPCLQRHISLSSQSTRTTSHRSPHSVTEY
ncbi:hypothetical protein PAMA_005586 [Pampus argenteus]